MTAGYKDFCSMRFRASSKRILSGDEVVEIIGPPEVNENGGIKQRVPSTQYDKTAQHIGTFLVTGPVIPPLPTDLRGGKQALDNHIKSLEQYGCEGKKKTKAGGGPSTRNRERPGF